MVSHGKVMRAKDSMEEIAMKLVENVVKHDFPEWECKHISIISLYNPAANRMRVGALCMKGLIDTLEITYSINSDYQILLRHFIMTETYKPGDPPTHPFTQSLN